MGIRESLLNTITSVGNSDFVRIVTSAGASSKTTVQNLFKSFETALGAKSSLTTSDYVRVVGSDDVAYKQSLSDVAKKIIENYTGSSLAGSSQSVKSALDALNSKTSSTLTVASGWTVGGNWCVKRNGICQMYIELTNGTYSTGWTTVATLPEGFRPQWAFDALAINNGSNEEPAVSMKIQATGAVSIYKLSNTTNNIRLSATFICA